jgi:hypothetical protein
VFKWITTDSMQRIFRYSVWALLPFVIFVLTVTEFLGPEDIASPLAGILFKVLAVVCGFGGIAGATILFVGMLLFCILGDRSPVWKRIIWAMAILAANLVAAVPYYFLVYRKQMVASR